MSSLGRRLSNLFPSAKAKETSKDIEPTITPSEPLQFAPPQGPPPGRPDLVQFPFLSPEQIPTLYSQGYARVHLPREHPLLAAATALFTTSRAFFATELAHKQQFHISKLNEPKAQNSEEGWSRVEGEKEMITIRRSGVLCPAEVLEDAQNLWKECGSFMQTMMHAIEASLHLPPGAFSHLVKEECVLPTDVRNETLMRMFRYERTPEARLVAAHHRDLGLLSLVIGSSPGLDVWDQRANRWMAIEEEPGYGVEENGGLTLTFLTGQTITRLTNGRYKPGVHRVFVPPAAEGSSADDAIYRYSLVYALRPHKKAIVSTSALTTDVTGEFQYPLEGVEAQTLFNAILNAHWSVNDEKDKREAQRLNLQRLKAQRGEEFSEKGGHKHDTLFPLRMSGA